MDTLCNKFIDDYHLVEAAAGRCACMVLRICARSPNMDKLCNKFIDDYHPVADWEYWFRQYVWE